MASYEWPLLAPGASAQRCQHQLCCNCQPLQTVACVNCQQYLFAGRFECSDRVLEIRVRRHSAVRVRVFMRYSRNTAEVLSRVPKRDSIGFTDMFELHQEYATLTNGQKVMVPEFDMYACGVECDSISRMNKNSVAGQGCIAKGEGRTGPSPWISCTLYI